MLGRGFATGKGVIHDGARVAGMHRWPKIGRLDCPRIRAFQIALSQEIVMAAEECLQAQFVDLLVKMDFARRYYEFYEKVRNRGPMRTFNPEEAKAVLASISPAFRYVKKERFFRCTDTADGFKFLLNVADLHHSQVEFIFYEKTHSIGGTYHGLAADVSRLSDPDFSYDPPYPRLDFSNLKQMKEAVVFGVSLYEEMKTAILGCSEWES
jgi:hypothetical protein